MAAPTLPSNVADSAKTIQGGSRISLGSYVTAGGNATLHYVGLVDDPIEQNFIVEYEDVDGGAEFLAPAGVFVARQGAELAFTVREMTIEMLGVIMGGTPTISQAAGISRIDSITNVAGDYTNLGLGNDREMAIGDVMGEVGKNCPTFFQVVIEHPNEGDTSDCDNFSGWTQLWKCIIKPTGAVSRSVRGLHKIPVSVVAYADPSVVLSVDATAGTGIESYGSIGRYHVGYS